MLIIPALVTGQTPFYGEVSKDDNAFPAHAHAFEDAFSEYCLDAPNSILTGAMFACYTSAMSEAFPRDWSDADIARNQARHRK